MNGVSVVICCHNSAARLPPTLAHLAAQQVPAGIPWEVIVVDNASTDDTPQVARANWPDHPPAQLRVVSEPELGLSNARACGLATAQYEYVSFVDDDNWVCPDWVSIVFDVLSTNAAIGACGGSSEAVFETSPPQWFNAFQGAYAVGAQSQFAGDVTNTRGFLWGAGLTVRKVLWTRLVDGGFRSLLTDRTGATLSAGGDGELCFALRLVDARLWYEPRLRIQHYLPSNRLRWSYLRKLYRGFGASRVGLDPYLALLAASGGNHRVVPRLNWRREAATEFRYLALNPRTVAGLGVSSLEGRPVALSVEFHTGRLVELLRWRAEYDKSIGRLYQARWMAADDAPSTA